MWLSRLFAVCVALFPSTSQADVTSQEVWTNLSNRLSSLGHVTFDAIDTVPGLTISKLTIKNDNGFAATLITPINMFDQIDGTVKIDLPEELDIRLTTSGGSYFTTPISSQDLVVVASGEADLVDYDLVASRLALQISGRRPNFFGDHDATIIATDIRSKTSIASTPTGAIYADINAARFDLKTTVNTALREKDRISATWDDVSASVLAQIPLEVLNDGADIREFPSASATYKIQTGPTIYSNEFIRSGTTNTTTSSAASSKFQFILNDGIANISTSATGLTGPIRIDNTIVSDAQVEAHEMSMDLTFPFAFSDTSRSFDLAVDLVDLTASPNIWDMFDPENVLPRSPLDLELELTGSGKIAFRDPKLPKTLSTLFSGGVLDSLDLKSLKLGFLGTTLDATGIFGFDYTDKLPDTAPRMDATLDLTFQGGFALLDNLTTLGVLTNQQAFMAQALSKMFARSQPNDTLTSTIKIRPDGSVTANGTPIR